MSATAGCGAELIRAGLAEVCVCGGVDILTQIGSVVSASEKVATIMLRDHVEHCVRESIEKGESADEKIEELTAAVERFLRV